MNHRTVYGVNIDPFNPVSRPKLAVDLEGLQWVRFIFQLDAAVDAQGQNLFHRSLKDAYAFYDRLISDYRAVGVRTLLVLNQATLWGNAPWLSPGQNPDGSGDWVTYANSFAALAGEIAGHFQGQGVAYEIWQRPTGQSGRTVAVPPAALARLLLKAVPVIREKDPGAPVILGGLAATAYEAIAYLEAVRDAANGTLPVDAIGVHPFGKWPPPFTAAPPLPGAWSGDLASHLKAISEAFSELPLWITEVGLADFTPLPPDDWPEAVRVITGLFDLANSLGPRLPVLMWYGWSDEMRHTGLVDGSGTPKPLLYDHFFDLVRRSGTGATAAPLPPEPFTLTPAVALHVRSGPGQEHETLLTVNPGDTLLVVGSLAESLPQIGQRGVWLRVETPEGRQGWLPAWFLRIKRLLLTPTVKLNVRVGPSTEHDTVTVIQEGDLLEVLEDPLDAVQKIDRYDRWINIKAPNGIQGWTAGWFLKLYDPAE